MVRSSDQLSRLLSALVTDRLGPLAGQVVAALLGLGEARLGQVSHKTGLSLKTVRTVLGVLVTHRLVQKRSAESSEFVVCKDPILAIALYPRFLAAIRDLLGDVAMRMVEHLVRAGQDSMTHALLELGRLMVTEEADMSRETLAKSLSDHQEMFKKLVKMDFIQHGDPLVTSPANYGVLDIVAHVREDAKDALEDKQMFHVNQMKVKQVVRDRIIAEAAERRLCPESGKLMTSVLRLVDAEPGSNGPSPHFSHAEIERQVARDHGADSGVSAYLDQHLRAMASDRVRWVDRVGDTGGGQYQVHLPHVLSCLVESLLESSVRDKFSSKAARVFKYILSHKYSDEGDLHDKVMMTAKDVKIISYELLDAQYIQMQDLCKAAAGNGSSKKVTLYYIDLGWVTRVQVSQCQAALTNLLQRTWAEAEDSARLLEKQQRIEAITASLRASGGSEEQLEEMAEMLSPPEREALARVTARLTGLQTAHAQTTEDLFMYNLLLESQRK